MNQSPKPSKIGVVSSRTSIHKVDNSKDENAMDLSEESTDDQPITDDNDSENETKDFCNSESQHFCIPECSRTEHDSAQHFYIPECARIKHVDNSQLYTPNLAAFSELNRSQHNISNTSQAESVFQHKGNPLARGFFLFIVSIIVCFFSTSIFSNVSLEHQITISYLIKKFPSQSIETLENIETIIDDVLKVEPIHPAVFLFLYKNENNNHDNFTDSVAEFASKKLGVNEEHITLNEHDYINHHVEKDYGYLIDEYKPILDLKKVMVIKNLHKMPGKTAQALHSFCDEFTPLVDRAVYILTLKVDSLQGNEIYIAENYLNKIWNKLDNDIRAPLITRVTSTVIKID